MKKFLLKIWDTLYEMKLKIADLFWLIFDFFYSRFQKPPEVASVEETINAIIENKASIARFGDGEIKLVAGEDISFQKATPFVVKKMRQVLSSDEPNLLIALADAFGDRSRYNEASTNYWKKHLKKYRRFWYKYLVKGKKYYNASMTRQYIALNDRSKAIEIYNKMKNIWNDKNVVFIEGEKSRLGVGNDLFANAKSIKRILCPATQAYDKYDEILAEACKQEKDCIFLLALGPAATGLAYDLHLNGYQAVDVGHIDVEYEWLLMGTKKRVPIKNKMVFEAKTSEKIEACSDEKYQSEIICTII